ncbi:hypothetical protein [Aquirhabdus sp.]|uniref:hypothetical protein n=1 Tax=Aquirhabdus sp. TaxID=2824160 RepID=UPI00396C5155
MPRGRGICKQILLHGCSIILLHRFKHDKHGQDVVATIMPTPIMRKSQQYLAQAILMTMLISLSQSAWSKMTVMPDAEMSEATGQSLLNLTYVAPGASGNNNMVDGSTTANVGFYRVGLQATTSINTNIQSLQLGCGGVNGPGCDINLSNVSLTGLNPGADGSYASSDATITNPYLEFAIKNPTSLSTREVEGFRIGAASILGRLSIGTNDDTTTTADDTGISSLSGNLTVNITNGKLNNIKIGGGLLTTTATIANYSSTQSLTRASTITLNGISATTGSLKLGGILPTISNLTLSNITLDSEPLSSVHNLALTNADGTATSDAYLSLQKTALKWQTISTGAFDAPAAQTGWWLSLPSITINNLNSNNEIDIPLLTALTGVFGTQVILPAFDLAQTPIQNCYGTLKFC